MRNRSIPSCAAFALMMLLPVVAMAQTPQYLCQWGTYGFGPWQFAMCMSLAVGPNGDVYTVDEVTNYVQVFTGEGVPLRRWNGGGDAWGLLHPRGVAVDAGGYVYVADTGHYRVQKFDSNGSIITRWGSRGDGPGQFVGPEAIAVDAAGNIYVSDAGNVNLKTVCRIEKFGPWGTFLEQWDATCGIGLAVDAGGNVFVVPRWDRVSKLSPAGTLLTEWGSRGTGDGQFTGASGVAVGPDGMVYVSDQNRIEVFTGDGTYLTQWGSLGSGDGQFDDCMAITTDAAGSIYVSDQRNGRIQKFGWGATPTRSTTWGRIKALYR